MVADNSHIAHAAVTIVCPEDRMSAVERLPVESVAADGEVHLFAVRGCFLPKMNEKIMAASDVYKRQPPHGKSLPQSACSRLFVMQLSGLTYMFQGSDSMDWAGGSHRNGELLVFRLQ